MLAAIPAAQARTSVPAIAPSSFSAITVTGSIAVDGSKLSLTPAGDGLVRNIVFPDGSSSKTVFKFLGGGIGTVREGESRAPTGMFQMGQGTLSILYADGRFEFLSLGADGKVSLLAKNNGEAACLSWYPAGHRFSDAERRSALSRFAARLGMGGASENSACPKLPQESASAAAPAGDPVAWNAFDNFYVRFVAPHEGGFVANDGNGSPANFGINQGANPDIDVAAVRQVEAEQILYQRYWLASGADQLPTPLAMVQGDTAINMGVKTANDLLSQSGGDPLTYLDLREEKYRAIAAANPQKADYLSLWLTRTEDLRDLLRGGDEVADVSEPDRRFGRAY